MLILTTLRACSIFGQWLLQFISAHPLLLLDSAIYASKHSTEQSEPMLPTDSLFICVAFISPTNQASIRCLCSTTPVMSARIPEEDAYYHKRNTNVCVFFSHLLKRIRAGLEIAYGHRGQGRGCPYTWPYAPELFQVSMYSSTLNGLGAFV